MHPTVVIVFDIFTLVLLGVTIFYCIRLSRQFERMRADRKAFELLIQALNTAAGRADASIKAFREMAGGNSDVLQERINKSRAMADELEIMIEAGDSLADRLEKLAESSSKAVKDSGPAPEESAEPAGARKPPSSATPRTRAEKELLEAVKAKQQS